MTRADIIEKLLGRCAEVDADREPVLSRDDLLELLGRANEMAYDRRGDAGRAVRAALDTMPGDDGAGTAPWSSPLKREPT